VERPIIDLAERNAEIADDRVPKNLSSRKLDRYNRSSFEFECEAGRPPESWADGQVARARGDKQKALAVFAAARKTLDATWETKFKVSTVLRARTIREL